MQPEMKNYTQRPLQWALGLSRKLPYGGQQIQGICKKQQQNNIPNHFWTSYQCWGKSATGILDVLRSTYHI